jgi:hypothetical protein
MSNNDKPVILTSVYGPKAPAAAKFGVGATTREQVEEAAQARRDVKPGQYRGER